MQNMSAYDTKAWENIQREKSKPTGRQRVRNAVPSTVKDTASKATSSARDTLQSAPGAARFQEVFLESLGGLIDLTSRLSAASVRDFGDRQGVHQGRSRRDGAGGHPQAEPAGNRPDQA